MKTKISLCLLALLLAACQTGLTTAVPTAVDIASLEVAIPEEGRIAVAANAPVHYQHNPPASGAYYPAILQYGLYEEDVAPALWVHTLERGGIVLLYKCSTECSVLKKEIGDLLDTVPLSKHGTVKLVIAPYDNMAPLIMAVAWNVQLPLQHFDAHVLTEFYNRHVDQGPEDVP